MYRNITNKRAVRLGEAAGFSKLWEIFCLCLLTLSGFAQPAAAPASAPLTNCEQILSLSRSEADEGRAVRVRGAITCYAPASSLCFVQDDTAGVYVFINGFPSSTLEVGDVVEIEGVTGSGRFSPIVTLAALRQTGARHLPAPMPVTIEGLNTGRFDAQWTQVEGVIQAATWNTGVCTLDLWTGGSSARVVAFALPASTTNLVDATIRMRGVGGTFYNEAQLTGFGLFSSGSNDLEVITPPPSLAQTPLRTVSGIVSFSRAGALDHRVRVRGTATVVWPGEAVFLQDDTKAVRVVSPSSSPEISSGDVVEAAGFLRDPLAVAYLDHAFVRKITTKALPVPPSLTLKQLVARAPSGDYVSVDGVISIIRRLEGNIKCLELHSGEDVVSAICRADFHGLAPGARVRLAGAWALPPVELRRQMGAAMWLNSPSAVTLLAAAPPPAELGALSRFKLWAVLSLIAFLLATLFAWRNYLALTRVSAEVRSGSLRLSETERDLQRMTEARERLGRDLHDRIIQGIYAIGLKVEHCIESAKSEPGGIAGPLRGALKDLNGVIGELRNLILGLETTAIEPSEFRTALKSLALALGREEANHIRISLDEAALNALTPAQATELTHIAREALSNSIRHGAAQTTSFILELRDTKIRFIAEDDGRGFSLEAAGGRGFGLKNMAKRAEFLGAFFDVSSEEGQGTRVLLDIPRQKSSFSKA